MDSKELLDRIYDYKKLREAHEPIMYLSRKAYEGKHFVGWDRNLNQIVETPRTKRSFPMELPETANQVDRFENFMLSTNYTFTVIPKFLSDDDGLKQSMFLSLLAQDYYKKFKMQNKLASMIKDGCHDNIAFAETSINDKKDDVVLRIWDAFDILFDTKVKDWEEQTLVIKVVRKKKEDIKYSRLYTMPTSPDSGDVFFSWKDVYQAEKYTSFVRLATDEILLFECFIITGDDRHLEIKTIDGAKNVYRDDHYKNIHKIPIRKFQIFSGDYYQPSFTYRLLPVNRGLDTIADRMSDIILRFAKAGWITQEDEDLAGSINDEVGYMLKYSATKPEQMDMPQVPPWITNWFDKLLQLSERYGLSSILSGNMPTKASGIRANSMLENLTQQSMQNNSATVDSLRSLVKGVLEDTFMFLYELWQTPRSNILTDLPQELKTTGFISQKTASVFQRDDKKLIEIPAEFSRFVVEIDDGLGYTLSERKNNAIMLRKLNMISDQTLKRVFKLGSTAYALEAEDKPMFQAKEFQQLIAQFPSMSDEEKQALIVTLQKLASQTGGPNSPATPPSVPLPNQPPITAPSGGSPAPGGGPGSDAASAMSKLAPPSLPGVGGL